MTSITASLEARLLVETVEIRPGRHVAVHHRPSSTSKPRIFFVHGSCASMLQYEALVAYYAAAGHEVVAYDYLGCGRSPKPRDWYAYSFLELRADLAAVVVRYGRATQVLGGSEEKKNLLVCHSAGCALALGILAQEVNASNPPYMFKAYYRQLVLPTADE
ncbi:hydrolase, partial [Chrysochromulina tobinii]